MLSAVLTSCKKDAKPEPAEFPMVTLNDISDVSSEGVTFYANVSSLGKYEILDYGFVWSDSGTKPTLSDMKISLGKSLQPGQFDLKIQSGLEKGLQYEVRAYIQTNKYLVYSNISSFVSSGSKPPKILSFTPGSGFDGSTITITGENFGFFKDRITVKVGPTEAVITEGNDHELKITTPEVSYQGNYKISVEVAGQTTYSNDFFTIKGPTITLVTPLQIRPGDLITITGDNLSVPNKQTVLTIGNTIAMIYSIDTKKIIAIVPGLVNSGLITVGVGQKKASANVTILPTWFNANCPNLWADHNEVFSINSKGYVLSEKKLYEYTPLTDSWNLKNSFIGNINEGSFCFVIGSKMYMGLGSGIDNKTGGVINSKDFWAYDQDQDTWIKLKDITEFTDNTTWAFTLNGKGYVSNYEKKLWCFDPQTNNWSQRNNLPEYIDGGFVAGNKAFIIIGGSQLWQYDDQNDSWFQKATLPYSISMTGALAVNDIGYISDRYSVYKYNSTMDIWSVLDRYPCGGGQSVFGFAIGNKIYLGTFGGGGYIGCQYSFYYMNF